MLNRVVVRVNAAKRVLLATIAVAAIALPLVAGFLVSARAAAQMQPRATLSPIEGAHGNP